MQSFEEHFHYLIGKNIVKNAVNADVPSTIILKQMPPNWDQQAACWGQANVVVMDSDFSTAHYTTLPRKVVELFS